MRGSLQKEVCHPEDPRLLGFEAQRVLLEAFHAAEIAGEPFDYIAFLEDDILLTDADFFLKLRCFNRAFGDQYLLMPNRIETMECQGQLRRFYIDGNYNPAASEAYRQSLGPVALLSIILGKWCVSSNLRTSIQVVFFSTASKREIRWKWPCCSNRYQFHGPLESAATLGMLKTFQLMKPAPENGRFLTVEHGGRNFMGLVPSLSNG